MMKPEEVHHMGRTLSRSETDSHRGLEPHVAEPNSGSCSKGEWDLVDAKSNWFP